MRILILAHSFNCLTQRVFVELNAAGHDVAVEFDIADSVTEEAVALWQPDLIVAPFLKRRIPDAVWRRCRCLVVHPGIAGDRGPSALDRAILEGESRWGVTVLEANGEMDAGDVHATVEFPMRDATKSSLYRNEITTAAMAALSDALEKIARGEPPTPVAALKPPARGRARPLLRKAQRAIDWNADDTAAVLRKIRAADGAPGVRDDVLGLPVHLFDAHPEGRLRGGPEARPGDVIARRDTAILRATIDGAVWIGHLKCADGTPEAIKLPATAVLAGRIAGIAEAPLAPDDAADFATWRPLWYREEGAVGYLHFPFYNGAMGTAQCEQLRAALVAARARPTRVIVLMGGPDFWSNGIHLNLIEAAAHPAEESWRNINAIDDLVREIVVTDRQLTIAALRGNAGAGGAFLALAADHVFARDGVVLNPHYKGMGNLYGSEYWTYLLPRRVGADAARTITQGRLPLAASQAAALGLVDACFGDSLEAFEGELRARAQALAGDPAFTLRLAARNARRAADEALRPLDAYRADELDHMRRNFFGFDPSYHVARDHFVRKVPRSRTPLYLARHRARDVATVPVTPRTHGPSPGARGILPQTGNAGPSGSTAEEVIR
jgi:putative two-component system hydrogenase maturation factor HypX/HoxX